MAVTPTTLRDRFRREVDDVLPDPLDDSAALWTDAEILEYLNEAQQKFVHGARYIVARVELSVVAGDAVVTVPEAVVALRSEIGYLQDRQVNIKEMAYSEFASAESDDYGMKVTGGRSAFAAQTPGRPRRFSMDIEANKLLLFPPSDTDDTLVIDAYVEAPELEDFNDALVVTNPRHARMLLDGMKEFAYGKQDAETYDPNQLTRYQARFEDSIQQVRAERAQRRRQTQPMPYGGI